MLDPRLTGSRLVASIVVIAAVGGCSLNFDQFPAERGEVAIDARVLSDTEPDAEPADVAGDLDAATPGDADTGVDADQGDAGEGTFVQRTCDDDDECGGVSICRVGFCTVECDADRPCPEGSFCATPGGESVCVTACTGSGECASLDRFVCADVSNAARQTAEGCLPDSDGDRVDDLADNCVSTPNPAQLDLDQDGLGDACDPEPACARGHTDGIGVIGPVDYTASGASVPQFAMNWVVAAGGRGAADDGASDELAIFDRRTTTAISATLPYPARDFGVVPISDDEYLLSPGFIGEEGQFGRFLHVSRDGTVRFGVPFEPVLYAPTLALGAGSRIWALAYDGPESAGVTAWRIYLYDRDEESFIPVGSGGDEGSRARWSAVRDANGAVHYYSAITDSLTRQGTWITAMPDGSTQPQQLLYPDPMTGSVFDPFFVPAPGGRYFVYDRRSGTAFIFDGADFVKAPELDVAVADLRSPLWVSQPTGPGFVIVAKDPADETVLQATSYSLPCIPEALTLDTDGDGVPDVVDLCPADPEAFEGDLDLDRIGDACDDDVDGDGIPNDADEFPLDTDNDGIPNDIDPDADGDGIPDDVDRWPLDTDNDGIRNSLDLDDDDDGYPDALEIAAGTDPLNPVDFPGAGRVIWVEAGELHWGTLADLDDPQTVPRAADAPQVRLPRLGPRLDHVLVLSGAPDATSSIEYLALADGSGAGAIDLGVKVVGADVLSATGGQLEQVVVSHARPTDPTKTDLSAWTIADGSARSITTVLAEIGAPDVAGESVTFAGQPPGCTDCANAYVVALNGGIPTIVAAGVSEPRSVRYTGSEVTLIGEASDGNGTSAWFGPLDDVREFRPPGAVAVTAAVGFGDGHLVVAATDADGDSIWFWNGARQRWHRLTTVSEPVVELDWAR